MILVFQGKPIFFTQLRLGYKAKEFKILKFCTMNNIKDNSGTLLDDFSRTTKLGRILRKYSLDEIPSIFNVIKNEMSLVGPRPFLAEYKSLYSEDQIKRHDVIPGITGWAQIRGRNAITWNEKFELDLWYVSNQSILLDIKIIFFTFWNVFRAKNINLENSSTTMPKFNGKN